MAHNTGPHRLTTVLITVHRKGVWRQARVKLVHLDKNVKKSAIEGKASSALMSIK